ncbi:hypothetical protein DCAR_0206759 [Daucus carota subsp. sativus]|uniref:Uncharacterized protein n=1 Tax=Daucus carota subsp. sativus TaxID=79200 RepID=A0AAF0WDU3_DAUCS|nr:PREDICTED: uncharacterized protein LOC108207009 [Daucus carota subsp. sativus]XP_017232958.1 PREDICTED: uncharacterized protein LOC108207009 [Daucus carota subsp. sativus]XP_017232959.1 PREDICTED: uncharacterized protein LOC108207009 [Daucus carota subsp. sativus]WOG87531.1 hypothetical protein DCAR_0206759 [Daucus carota subsp. sativus]
MDIRHASMPFGILCCLNSNFENSLPPGVSRIGFNINTIRLPSQAEGNLINLDAIPKLDNASYLTIFGQTILFIFKTATSQNFNYYNTVRLNGLKAAAGVDASTTVTNPYNLSKAQCVRSVLGSSLFVKKKLINMIVSMQNGEEKINAVCRYVATILEYNEMSAIMVTYETLVRTKSVVLTDPRLLPEMMNLCEALELICQSDMPQYFKYMAPPEQAAKLERNRFPTLAATGELLKRDFNKHASFKNFVGERKFSKLAEELAQLHRRSVARNTPATLDVLTKQPCHPVGPTIIGDDEDWDDVC